MSNAKASMDYLKLVGAQVKSVDINGKMMNCVVIPVDWNGIKVRHDAEADKITSATQYTREWTTNQKFRDACMANHQGDPDYVAPSHQISVSYPEELEKAYLARHEALVRKDERFMATNPTEEAIKQEAKNRLSNQTRIGYVTPIKPREAPVFTGDAPVATTGAYVPPATEVQPGDDLPF